MAEIEYPARAVKRIRKTLWLTVLSAAIAFVSLIGMANAYSGSHMYAASDRQSVTPLGQIELYSSPHLSAISPDNFINV